MTTAPKAFISHASEDKDAFVLTFARQLTANGIDTWLDQWEIAGGDSLPDRIFQQGIGAADAVIVVLSQTSLEKPWVREELDVAVVRKISGKSRLVPVVLDDVEIPVSVEHLFRYDVPSIGRDATVDGITRTLFGRSTKPSLGVPPSYSTVVSRLGSADPADEIVYEELLRVLRSDPPNMMRFSDELEAAALASGVSHEAFHESMEVLTQTGRISAQPMLGRTRWWRMSVPDRAWLAHEADCGLNLDAVRRDVLGLAVNGEFNSRIAELNLHWRTIAAVLSEFEREDLVRWYQDANGGIHLQSVTPLARRKLRLS